VKKNINPVKLLYNITMRKLGFILVLVVSGLLYGCGWRPGAIITTPSVETTPSVHPSSTPFLPTFTPIPQTVTPKPALILKKGPYLLFGSSPEGMTIIWQGDANDEYTFEWGTNELYLNGSSLPTGDSISALYQVRLSGLMPGTRYYYRVSTAQAEVRGSFVTPPLEGDSLTFFAYGDTRSGPEIHDQISASILQQIAFDPSAQTFIISTGDLMDTANEESLQENEFARDQPNIRASMAVLPVVNIMGNHDGTKLFKQYFPYPYTSTYDWAFDYGPAHFVVIDQYIDLVQGSERWFWLKEDLSGTQKPWKFILLHEPGWSAGPHENNSTVQMVIQPLAVAYGVQVIIAGHNHYYARAKLDGVTHITTGGGGAPLYDPEHGWPRIESNIKAFHYIKFTIQGDTLNAQVLSPDGKLLEKFILEIKEPQ
jgi:predicted phosphodiesterase